MDNLLPKNPSDVTAPHYLEHYYQSYTYYISSNDYVWNSTDCKRTYDFFGAKFDGRVIRSIGFRS